MLFLRCPNCGHEVPYKIRVGFSHCPKCGTFLGDVEPEEEESPSEAKQIATLPQKEVAQLCQKIRQGDHEAKRKMIERNLGLVVKIAKKYVNRGVPLMDLIQEGNLGLMKAVERYDYKKRKQFRFYAWYWIRQAIQRAIDSQSPVIHIPAHVLGKIHRWEKYVESFRREIGRDPTVREASKKLRVSLKELIKIKIMGLIDLYHGKVPLHSPAREATDPYIRDLLREERELEMLRLKQLIDTGLMLLKPKERDIIRLRFGLEHTLDQTGRILRMSREGVRQREKRALNKLKGIISIIERTPERKTGNSK